MMHINFADFGKAEIPNEFKTAQLQGSVTLIPHQLAFRVVEEVVNPYGCGPSLYLTGPGGVGKTSILFQAASESLRHNREAATLTVSAPTNASAEGLCIPVERRLFLLMYIPNTSDLIEKSPEYVALHLCRMVIALNAHLLKQETDLYNVLIDQNETGLERWTKFCLQLVDSSLRSLILLDQWNAVVNHASNFDVTHPLTCFDRLSATIGNSKFVAALSSSFLPIDSLAFSGAEGNDNERKIDPFSWEETKKLRDIWSQRLPPINVNEALLLILFNETGGIPRLCEYFAAIRSANPDATTDDFDWRQRCINYYTGRIIRFQQHINDDNMKSRFINELTSLYLLNQGLPCVSCSTASRWLCSGLLVRREDRLVPVNPFVRRAVNAFVFQEQSQILRQLYHDSATKWRAVELFVALKFRECRQHTLVGTNLCGKNDKSLDIVEDNLKSVELSIDFARDPNAFLDRHNGGLPFPGGTILIPSWPNHAVPDMVLLVNLGEVPLPVLIFVQVSMSAYADHRTKIRDLLMKPRGWNASVLKSFMLAFGLDFPVSESDLENGTLPERVRYIYATTSTKLVQLRDSCRTHDVILMREQNISAMDEVMWNIMVSE